MSVFEAYAAVYDLLYADKDYPAEVDYVLGLFEERNSPPRSLLDLGCGSGRHAAEFARRGVRVIGVDRSPSMLAMARRTAGPEFVEADVAHYAAPREMDAAVALFHVFSYLTADDQIETFLENVRRSLRPGGLFLFDFWYGPAVLGERPSVRVKRAESEECRVFRVAEPALHEARNLVDVTYTLFIERANGGVPAKLVETHTMRYFFLPEVERLLRGAGLELLDSHEWMTRSPLSCRTWSATALAARR